MKDGEKGKEGGKDKEGDKDKDKGSTPGMRPVSRCSFHGHRYQPTLCLVLQGYSDRKLSTGVQCIMLP